MSRIITDAELRPRNLAELQVLHRKLQSELTATAPGTAARRNLLASLETVERAMGQRRLRPTFPKPGL